MTKIIKNADGSTFFVSGNVMLTKKGVDNEVVDVGDEDIEKMRSDNKYMNELLVSSKIKKNNKHGT